MTDIYEYRQKIIAEIKKFAETADVQSYEISNSVKQAKEDNADFREFAKGKDDWFDFIYGNKDVASIDSIKETMFKVINGISKRKREEKLGEAKKDTEWWKGQNNYWSERADWWRKYNANELDWQKDQEKRDEENKKQLEDSEKNRDEKHKKQFISEVEMELIENNVSDERLSKRAGVSDWREKIRQADGFSAALSMRSSLKKLVWSNLKNEYTCASCGVKKEEFTVHEKEGKKYCSYECKDKDNEKDKKDDDKKDSPTNRKSEFKDFSIEQFFTLLKKLGAKSFWYDFDTNQVMVEFNDNKKKQLKEIDSGLSSEEQESLTKQLKSSSKPITFSEVDKELNRKGKTDNKGNAGIIAAVVVAGLILAVIIGVVIGKSKKKDY